MKRSIIIEATGCHDCKLRKIYTCSLELMHVGHSVNKEEFHRFCPMQPVKEEGKSEEASC